MPAGPKRGHLRPQMSRPGQTGPSRTIARLIRERPVSVNVARCRNRGSLKRRNWREYICFRGVFTGKTATNLGRWNRQTLAIRNLTGSGAGTHPEPQRAISQMGAVLRLFARWKSALWKQSFRRPILVSVTDD